MSASIPEGAIALGSNLFFFKSTANSTDCLISAHGGYTKSTRPFDVRGDVEVLFYADHGNTLTDPGMDLTDQHADALETRRSGDSCWNYGLTKYQGRHGGTAGKPAETYQSINKRVGGQNSTMARLFEGTQHANAKFATFSMQKIQASRSMSVVTIRNRWSLMGGDVYLKDVIKTVREKFPGMRRFHCSFCRSLVGDDNAATNQVVFK